VDFWGPVVHTTRGYSEDAPRGFMGDVVAKESRGFFGELPWIRGP